MSMRPSARPPALSTNQVCTSVDFAPPLANQNSPSSLPSVPTIAWTNGARTAPTRASTTPAEAPQAEPDHTPALGRSALGEDDDADAPVERLRDAVCGHVEVGCDARTANQNGDTYVLTTVLFASVLFFAGVSTKLASARNRAILLGVGVAILIVAAITVLTFPVEI